MKKILSALTLAVAFTLATATPAHAEEKMLGTVTKIDLAGATATATLKDSKSGSLVDLLVDDTVTLDKFKDKRIGVGDEIKAKFEKKDGKNHSTFFKKAGGC
ncbi:MULTISPECIES: hypothetical protein [Anaeromyxobacter]|uniref:hypothetical protein n=1 Tax=Anaeromyxobacter TaxID=161492 RepID=UPI001F59A738|nr:MULTISPECIES: hypothetical protein [unclassified Anaeromyxobacter]